MQFERSIYDIFLHLHSLSVIPPLHDLQLPIHLVNKTWTGKHPDVELYDKTKLEWKDPENGMIEFNSTCPWEDSYYVIRHKKHRKLFLTNGNLFNPHSANYAWSLLWEKAGKPYNDKMQWLRNKGKSINLNGCLSGRLRAMIKVEDSSKFFKLFQKNTISLVVPTIDKEEALDLDHMLSHITQLNVTSDYVAVERHPCSDDHHFKDMKCLIYSKYIGKN